MEALIPSAVGAAASQTAQADLPKPGGAGGFQPCGGAGARERAGTCKCIRARPGKGCGSKAGSMCLGWLGANLDFSLLPFSNALLLSCLGHPSPPSCPTPEAGTGASCLWS